MPPVLAFRGIALFSPPIITLFVRSVLKDRFTCYERLRMRFLQHFPASAKMFNPIRGMSAGVAAQSCSRSRAVIAFQQAVAAAAHSRTYFNEPIPSLTAKDVEKLAVTGMRRHPGVFVGAALCPEEHAVVNAAKREGVIRLTPICTQTVCNHYYRYCYATERPYIAMDRHGQRVIFDPRPVLGQRKVPVAERMTKLLAASQEAVVKVSASSRTPLQISSDALLKKQSNATLPGPLEGSNKTKISLQSFADAPADVSTFTVHTVSKAQAMAVAEALYSAHITTFGLAAPAEIAEKRAAAKLAEKTKIRRIMLRKLRKLVADPEALRQLRTPLGVVDGFKVADGAGTVRN